MKEVSLLLWLLLCVPATALALSSDADQPIQVEADSLEIRDQDNISIYRGHVRLLQGSLEIHCAELTLHFDAEDELTLMEMNGSPATLRQLDENRQEIYGEATRMEYRASETNLLLLGNARLTHLDDTIESNRIQINTENDSISAGSTEPDNRVRVLIQPRQ